MGEIQSLKPRWKEIGARYLKGESTYDIGKDIGAYLANIRQILIMLNIPRRTPRESNIAKANSIQMSASLMERINGWLLGDGGISYSGHSGMFNLSSKHLEYVEFAQNMFKKEDIKSKIYTRTDKKYKTVGHSLRTLSTIQFGKLYKKWYPNNKKIVPKDLSLSNRTIKHWIMDDGTVSKLKGHLRLSTCCFSVDECERLSGMLNEFIGIDGAAHVTEKHKYPRIYVPKRFTQPLLHKIGKCEVNCFQYKWNNIKKD